MKRDKTNALVPRPGTDITAPARRTSPVIARMTQDILARTKAQTLKAARHRIGDYELREPDYRQILTWAKALDLRPEAILDAFEESRVLRPPCGDDSEPICGIEPIEFVVENGAIVSLPWNFDALRHIPEKWEEGLCIRALGFEGSVHLSNLGTKIKPVLPSLKRLVWYLADAKTIDLTQTPELTVLHCSFEPGCDVGDVAETLGLSKTELDLSPVPKLIELDCEYRGLIELDLSPVPRLTRLDCSCNPLTELDLSPVPGLTRLDCRGTQLTELDLSPVPGLTVLYCDNGVRIYNAPRGLVCDGTIVRYADDRPSMTYGDSGFDDDISFWLPD